MKHTENPSSVPSKVGTKPAAFTYVMKYFRVAAFDLFPCLTAHRGDGARGAAPLSRGNVSTLAVGGGGGGGGGHKSSPC